MPRGVEILHVGVGEEASLGSQLASELGERMKYIGEGYAEILGDRIYLVFSVPILTGGLEGLSMVRIVQLLDPQRNRVLIYSEDLGRVYFERLVKSLAYRERHGDILTGSLEEAFRLYSEAVDAVEEELDRIEDMVEEAGDLRRVVRTTYTCRKALTMTRQGLRSYIQLLRDVAKSPPSYGISNGARLSELADEAYASFERLEILRETLASLREAHASMLGLRLNEVVKRLTALTLVLMLPTLIASIYGMNFDRSYPLNMPELSWSFGYIYALGLMIFSTIAGYIVLKAKGWF